MSSTKGHLYTFGQAFSKYKKVYLPDNPVSAGNEKFPGPGAYNDKTNCIGLNGRKSGMQGRSKNMSGK